MGFLQLSCEVFTVVVVLACMFSISTALLGARTSILISHRLRDSVALGVKLRSYNSNRNNAHSTWDPKEKRVSKTRKIPRVYVASSSLCLNMDVTLPDDTSHYITNVMRMRAGDQIRVFNGIDTVDFIAEVQPIERKKGPVKLQIVSTLAENTRWSSLPPISVIFSPLKKPRLKFLIEKLTEIGVSSLIPLITTRTEARFESISSYQKTIIESCEQCERSSIPSIQDSINLASIIKNSTTSMDFMSLLNVDRLLVCVERSSTSQPLLSALADWQINDERLGVVIGPEGGFSDEEVKYLTFLLESDKNTHGNGRIVLVSLGLNILRAETAGVFALSCVTGYHDSSCCVA